MVIVIALIEYGGSSTTAFHSYSFNADSDSDSGARIPMALFNNAGNNGSLKAGKVKSKRPSKPLSSRAFEGSSLTEGFLFQMHLQTHSKGP